VAVGSVRAGTAHPPPVDNDTVELLTAPEVWRTMA
jgi:hypothetical protein